MDGKKNEIVDTETLEMVPEVPAKISLAPPDLADPRLLTTRWSTALALAPVLLFIAIGEFAPDSDVVPSNVDLAVGFAMLFAMIATSGLAMAHRIGAAVPAIGLGAFGVYGQVDCALADHAATGTAGFWVITAAFAGLGLIGVGSAVSGLRSN